MSIQLSKRKPRPDSNRRMSSWVVTDAQYIGYEARWKTKKGLPLKSNFMKFLMARHTITGDCVIQPFTLSMDIHRGSEFYQLCIAAGVFDRDVDLTNLMYRDCAAQIGADLRERCPTVLVEFAKRKGGESLGILDCKSVTEYDAVEDWMKMWPEDKVFAFKKTATS